MEIYKAQDMSDALNEMLSRVDFVQMVSAHTKLRLKGGSTYEGKSPFRSEKTGSFRVDSESKIFKCFSTGFGGGVIKFLEHAEGMDRAEAIVYLAEQTNVELPNNGEIDTEAAQKKRKMREAVEAANNFFRGYKKQAREYLVSRNLPLEILDEYELGYAPENPELFIQAMKYQGYDDQMLLDIGLAKWDNKNKNRLLARHVNRLMIPIKDKYGKTVSFSGRRPIDPDEDMKVENPTLYEKLNRTPKYLHGEKYVLFQKDRMLWGLDHARKLVRQHDFYVVVEGFFDAITLQRAGFAAVAVMGAIATDNQLEQLSKLTSNTYHLTDSDVAGREALIKFFFAIERLDLDMLTFAVNLSNYAKDPDEFLQKYSVEDFKKLLNRSMPDTTAVVESLASKHTGESTTQAAVVRKVLEEVKPYIKVMRFSYRSQDLIERLAQTLNLRKGDLTAWLNTAPNFGHSSNVYNKINSIMFPAPVYEKRILIECLREPSKVFLLKERKVSLYDFESHLVSKVLGVLYYLNGGNVFVALEDKLSPEDYNLVVTALQESHPSDFDIAVETLLSKKARLEGKKRTNVLGRPLLTPTEKEMTRSITHAMKETVKEIDNKKVF